jgi:transposase
VQRQYTGTLGKVGNCQVGVSMSPSRNLQTLPSAIEMTGYTGFMPSEYSSGGRERKGRLTRSDNAQLRHVLGEAAWHARHRRG